MTQQIEGSDASKLSKELYNHGFFTASEAKRLQKLHFLKAEDEDEDEDSGEDEDEDARIRAAFPLIKKAMKRAANYQKSLKQLGPDDEERMEDQNKYAEDRAEDEDEDRMEDEDEDRAEDSAPEQEGPIKTPGDQHRDIHDLGVANKPKVSYSGGGKGLGPGQLGAMKLMSADEKKRYLAAQNILASEEKEKMMAQVNAVEQKQELRKKMASLNEARKTFEANKDTAGMKAVDEHLAKIKAQLEPQVDKVSQGAQTPSSTPVIATKAPTGRGSTPAALRAAFNAELAPAILANPRFQGLRFKEGPQ